MIQRIQSLFLLLAAGTTALLFNKSLSFVSIFGDATALKAADQAMLADGVFEVNDHIILQILTITCIALPILALVLYKNRATQMKLSRINIAALVMLIALSVILFVSDYKLIAEGTEVTIEYGYIIPVVSLVLVILALRFIRKDDQLVRSADRLR